MTYLATNYQTSTEVWGVHIDQILQLQQRDFEIKHLKIPALLRSSSQVILNDLSNPDPLSQEEYKGDLEFLSGNL